MGDDEELRFVGEPVEGLAETPDVGIIEGGINFIEHAEGTVQYHPESNPGPQDSVYLFEDFVKDMKKNAKKKRY